MYKLPSGPLANCAGRNQLSFDARNFLTGARNALSLRATTNIAVSVNQNAQTLTVDGTTYDGVQFITINGNNNGDTISIFSNDENGAIGAAVNGGSGNDTLSVSDMTGVIHGGGGQDTLTLNNSIYGEVYGDTGSDTIFVSGDSIDAQIVAGTGNTMVDATRNNYGVVIAGSSGDDTLFGSAYDDQIYGNGGNDIMYGFGGNDTFYSTGGVVVGGCDGVNVAYVQTGSYVSCYNTQFIYNY